MVASLLRTDGSPPPGSSLLVVRGDAIFTLGLSELAQAALLLLGADKFLAGSQLENPVTRDALERASSNSGQNGTRYELAVLELLTREHNPRLHDVAQQAFLHATTNADVLYSVGAGTRLRVIGFAREKSRHVRGAVIARTAEDLQSRLHQSAKLVTPAAKVRFPVLQPMADRDRHGNTRLDVLVKTPTNKRLEGFPPAADQLHHADLLVGTYDGRYWLGADVKSSQKGRPPKRTRWSGIGLDIDVLIGESFKSAAKTAGVDPEVPWFAEGPRSDGVPRLTIASAHDAFAAIRKASDAIYWAQTSSQYEVRHGSDPEDQLATLIKEHLYEPLDILQQELQARAGQVLVATYKQISQLGRAPSTRQIVGALA